MFLVEVIHHLWSRGIGIGNLFNTVLRLASCILSMFYITLFIFVCSGVDKMNKNTNYLLDINISLYFTGGSILAAAVMFSRRSVSALILRKGGENVTFVLFGFLGIRTSFTVPISRVSCRHSRSAVTSQLPMKVKGHSFHYILDKQQGRFLNGRLFDYTVGMKRVFV